MSIQNICIYGEKWKIIPKLSQNTHIICVTGSYQAVTLQLGQALLH